MGSQGCWECAIGEEGALIDGVKYAAVHPWGLELSLLGTSSPGLVGRSGCREPWCARLEASVCVVVVLVAAHTNRAHVAVLHGQDISGVTAHSPTHGLR